MDQRRLGLPLGRIKSSLEIVWDEHGTNKHTDRQWYRGNVFGEWVTSILDATDEYAYVLDLWRSSFPIRSMPNRTFWVTYSGSHGSFKWTARLTYLAVVSHINTKFSMSVECENLRFLYVRIFYVTKHLVPLWIFRLRVLTLFFFIFL